MAWCLVEKQRENFNFTFQTKEKRWRTNAESLAKLPEERCARPF
jgi:hypothetical protein